MFVGDYTWETFSGVDFDYARMFDSLKSRGLNLGTRLALVGLRRNTC